MQYRHGDVLIEKVKSIPTTAKKQRHLILAEGEITGHSHRIQELDSAILFRDQGRLFLHVTSSPATIVHEEHKPISLPEGMYRIWQQREYTPTRIITVRD